MSDYEECHVHDLMYDSDRSCPECDKATEERIKAPLVAVIRQLADGLDLIFASTLPYREDGTTTLKEKAVDACNAALEAAKPYRS